MTEALQSDRSLERRNALVISETDYARSFFTHSRSCPDAPLDPKFWRYECSAAAFLNSRTYPVWFTDPERQEFLEHDDEGASPITFVELAAIEHLRKAKLDYWTLTAGAIRAEGLQVLVEHCLRCGRRVVKDGCHRLLALAHEGRDAALVVWEMAGDDWRDAKYDMRVVCDCIRGG